MGAKTYDPRKVIITFGGVPISGFADGTFLAVTPASDRYTKHVGADGETARAKVHNKTHEVVITLIQTSLSNNYLSTMMALDAFSDTGVAALSITDLSGTTLYFWNTAWIRKAPNLEGKKEVGDRQWTFDTGQAVTEFIGGTV